MWDGVGMSNFSDEKRKGLGRECGRCGKEVAVGEYIEHCFSCEHGYRAGVERLGGFSTVGGEVKWDVGAGGLAYDVRELQERLIAEAGAAKLDVKCQFGGLSAVVELMPVVVGYMGREGNGAGGDFHVVLMDGNVADKDVWWCLGRAMERKDLEGVELGVGLLKLSRTQRLKLGRAIRML